MQLALTAGVRRSIAENIEFLRAIHLAARAMYTKNLAARNEDDIRRRQQEKFKEAMEADWPIFIEALEEKLVQHAVALMRNLRRAYQIDDYGAVTKDDRSVEIEKFLRSVGLLDRAQKHGLEKARSYIIRWHEDRLQNFESSSTIPENGHDFEHWVAAQLAAQGWDAKVTQASGDDGVDIIATKERLSVAVQCKRYAGSVGNKAVQEVYTGMTHMQLDRAVVISTGNYTKAAHELAQTTGVLLLSEVDIPHLYDLLRK